MGNSRRSFIIGCLIFCVLLSSCGDISAADVPTLLPTEHIPTVIAMTLAAQGIVLVTEETPPALSTTIAAPVPTQPATETSQPSPTLAQSTLSPSPTGTPSPETRMPEPAGDLPESTNQILGPGPGSKVISPFILRAELKPGNDSVVHIELIGQDGQILMREIRSYQILETDWISLGSEITYGINTVAEPGRLQISIVDEHGRLKSVRSVDLVLQSTGIQDLNHPKDQLEQIALESPPPNRLIQGGTMRVSGMARPHSSQPFRIEIVTSDGKIVGTRQVSVMPTNGNQYGSFAIDVPYNIAETNRVRVQVWEPGDQIPGIINLSSVEVLLSP